MKSDSTPKNLRLHFCDRAKAEKHDSYGVTVIQTLIQTLISVNFCFYGIYMTENGFTGLNVDPNIVGDWILIQ